MARRWIYEEVKHYIEVESGSDCKLLSKEYINYDTKMGFKCKCGNEFEISYDKFLHQNKRQCNECGSKSSYKNRTKTTEQFKNEVYKLVGNEYRVLSDYKTAKAKIKMIHDDCGYIYYVRPDNFLNGTRCPYCFGNIKKTTKEFTKEVYDLVGDEYEVLGNYINSDEPIMMKHNLCGQMWEVRPYHFIGNSSRCPYCFESKGEQKVKKYLENNNIYFTIQEKFDNCRNIKLLPFDFYLPNCNLLIEYDGEQHFKPTNFGGISDKKALKNFNQTKQNDQIKNQYCKDNDIPLLRIPYWDFDNIEQILEEWLHKYGVLHRDLHKEIA